MTIGEIGRPYGRGGEVHVTPLTDDLDRFARVGDCALLDPTGEREPRRLTAARRQGAGVIVALAGCDSPEAARTLGGRLLAIPESEVLPLDEGHFYAWQLEGCRVVTADGQEVGRVAGIEGTAAHDLWVVRDGPREHLIPAVAEIVREVDLAGRRVVISPPAGLLDL
ncbi:MAG: ribosome maturation factor RimM [Candidatus Rokuibacteriota bacterium]